MGLTNYQHALRKKYSALTGELEEVRVQIKRIQREQAKLPALQARISKLEALIASAAMLLKDASDEWEPEQSPPVRPYTHTLPVPYGTCGRRAMDVLRRADKPMTVRQIAMQILIEAEQDIPEPKVLLRRHCQVNFSSAWLSSNCRIHTAAADTALHSAMAALRKARIVFREVR